uniref:Cuticle protein 6 n=1 Tax=Schizaphis graminum TaxID=13262 RepID=A0A2S2PPR4_SCHGA
MPTQARDVTSLADVRRSSRAAAHLTYVFYCVFQLAILGTVASKIDGGWDTEPNTQYHIQTDEGPERYFKYQTISGQYRKERRLQDGSVVGTYGWVDADGYLRLNDYVADSKGYRIVKNKKLFVGTQTPVGQAVSVAKYTAPVAGTAVSASPYRSATVVNRPPAVVAITPAPPRESSWRGSPFVYPSDTQSSPLRFPAAGSPPRSVASQFRRPQPTSTPSPAAEYYSVRPVDVNSIVATGDSGDGDEDAQRPYRRRSSSSTTATVSGSTAAEHQPLYEQPLRPHTFRPAYRKVVDLSAGTTPGPLTEQSEYDGVSFVRNGFKYYLPRHYHEEQSDDAGDTRAGSFGYVDPFGIRRVVYYNTAPGTGFVHRKNNRYVGLDAEPYDPRPSQ